MHSELAGMPPSAGAPSGRAAERGEIMVEIHLYGNLRKYARALAVPGTSALPVEPVPDETIASLLARLGISTEEINHIFYNSKLLATRRKAAVVFSLPQAGDNTLKWDLAVPVAHGDRLGLFGRDIPVLSM
jgi:hypothetical protein